MQIYQTTIAGQLRRVVVYPKLSWKDRRARGPRRALTTKAQEKLNHRKSFEHLEELIHCNFERGFRWVTLTYRDTDLPPDRPSANKKVAAFLRKLRTHWRRHGAELKYIYCTQEVQSDGSRRLHHHLILNRCGPDDFDVIRSLWTWCDPIGVDVQWLCGHEQITDKAHYMTHEARDHGKQHKGARQYTASQNLSKPVKEAIEVPDDVTVTAPYGAIIIDSDAVRNEYGAFTYIKYVLPARPQNRGLPDDGF